MEAGDAYAKREQFDDVRPRLANWLDDEYDDPTIDTRIWDCLLDDRELMLAARRGEIAKLAQSYGILLKHFGRRPRRERHETEIGPDARSDALAQIAAIAAQRDVWGIRGFRQRHLGNRLLTAEEIPTWVEEQALREGPTGKGYVEVPMPDWKSGEMFMCGDPATSYVRWLRAEAERVAADPKAELPERALKGPRYLSYGVPGQRDKSIAIRVDGALAELKKIASGQAGILTGLCGRVPWGEPEAVAFILSGWVPPLPKARVHTSFSGGFYPALSRLGIEVDPRLTPKEVAQLYNRTRARYIQGRDRPMDEKHMALAVFTEQTRHEGTSWSELREHWNAEHPEWAFKPEDLYAKRFALECRTAWSRVTGEKWGYQRGAKVPVPRRPPKKNRAGPDREATR